MDALSQYWNMWCISPGDEKRRYRRKPVESAKAFYRDRMTKNKVASEKAELSAKAIQERLLSQFRATKPSLSPHFTEVQARAYAGLCLRCYVSAPILTTCQKIDRLFSGNKSFDYQDLLPFVLNDDGKTLVVTDDSRSQRTVSDAGELEPSTFKVFSVEVLKTYRDNRADSMSLYNWACLRTKQHPELKRFLMENGFKPYSDWTLLNRIQVNQLERLSEREQAIAKAFHAVYRRDRQIQKQVGRCKNPTSAQLVRMNQALEQENAAFSTTTELLEALKRIAKQLRTFDIWQAREPLEVKDMETGDYTLRTDLPAYAEDDLSAEERDLLAFLQHQISIVLASAVEQAVQNRIVKLRKSKKYSPFADTYLVGLYRYYKEGLPFKEIGSQLGMNNWDQTRRILNPGELLNQVRRLTIQQLSTVLVKAAQEKGLAATPVEPAYLRTLLKQIETFVDGRLFAEASSEIKASKNRSLDSEYAKALIQYLERAS